MPKKGLFVIILLSSLIYKLQKSLYLKDIVKLALGKYILSHKNINTEVGISPASIFTKMKMFTENNLI